eukprot:4081344-Pyramimonas_sp.AAC.1
MPYSSCCDIYDLWIINGQRSKSTVDSTRCGLRQIIYPSKIIKSVETPGIHGKPPHYYVPQQTFSLTYSHGRA